MREKVPGLKVPPNPTAAATGLDRTQVRLFSISEELKSLTDRARTSCPPLSEYFFQTPARTHGRIKLKPRDRNQDGRAPEQVPPWIDQEGARDRKRARRTAATRRVTQTTSRCKLPPKNKAGSHGLEHRTRRVETQKANQRDLVQVGPRATQP